MKQSFSIQLIVDENDPPLIAGQSLTAFSYAELHDILRNAAFEVEHVPSPGCKSGTVIYLKRKAKDES